jgi:hypothetical protein
MWMGLVNNKESFVQTNRNPYATKEGDYNLSC